MTLVQHNLIELKTKAAENQEQLALSITNGYCFKTIAPNDFGTLKFFSCRKFSIYYLCTICNFNNSLVFTGILTYQILNISVRSINFGKQTNFLLLKFFTIVNLHVNISCTQTMYVQQHSIYFLDVKDILNQTKTRVETSFFLVRL